LGLEERLAKKINRKKAERTKIIREIESIEEGVTNRGAKALGGTTQFGCLGILGLNLLVLGIIGVGFAVTIQGGFSRLLASSLVSIMLALFFLSGSASGKKRVDIAAKAAREIKECKTRLLSVEKEINQIKTLLDP